MSNLLTSTNSLDFLEKATNYYNKNLNFKKEFINIHSKENTSFKKFEFCNVDFKKISNKKEYIIKDLTVSFKKRD